MRKRGKLERDAVVEVAHRPGCYAVAAVQRGDWSTPWALLDREHPHAHGTSTGNMKAKSRNHTRWLRFVCNDTQCNARLLINEYRMLETFGKLTK